VTTSQWLFTLKPNNTWNSALKTRAGWSFGLKPVGEWSSTVKPRGMLSINLKSEFTRNVSVTFRLQYFRYTNQRRNPKHTNKLKRVRPEMRRSDFSATQSSLKPRYGSHLIFRSDLASKFREYTRNSAFFLNVTPRNYGRNVQSPRTNWCLYFKVGRKRL